MFDLSLGLLLFFLTASHFLSSLIEGLSRWGETAFLRELPNFYRYTLLRGKSSFSSLLFSLSLASHISRLGYGASLLLTLFSSPLKNAGGFLLFFLLGTLLLLFISDLLPRLLSFARSPKLLHYSAPFSIFFLWITLPLLFSLVRWAAAFQKRVENKAGSDPMEELKESLLKVLQQTNIKGKLSQADQKLLEAALKFKDRIVREVMVPRIDLFSLPSDTTIKEAAGHFIGEGYSRIPVYQESMDNITGVLMFKDFLRLYREIVEGKKDLHLLNSPISSLTKEVFYTPETKKVSHLLQEFRTKQMHLAIVVDEYGGTEGVVTMEDILEEIVGEISDEYDFDENVLYTPAAGGGWIVDARMSILDAEDAFGISIPLEGEYDTIGGYIFHKVGSIPEKGQVISLPNFAIEILSHSQRSIDKVKITEIM